MRFLYILFFMCVASSGFSISPQKAQESLELKLLFHDVFKGVNQAARKQQIDPAIWKQIESRSQVLIRKLPKAGQDEVRSYLRGPITKLQDALLKHFQVKLTPALSPRLDVGEKLYFEHCQSCHGSSKAKGKLEDQMKSMALWYPLSAQEDGVSYTPIMVVNRLLISVPNSPMPRFLDFLTVQEIWDVAYYVQGASSAMLPKGAR